MTQHGDIATTLRNTHAQTDLCASRVSWSTTPLMIVAIIRTKASLTYTHPRMHVARHSIDPEGSARNSCNSSPKHAHWSAQRAYNGQLLQLLSVKPKQAARKHEYVYMTNRKATVALTTGREKLEKTKINTVGCYRYFYYFSFITSSISTLSVWPAVTTVARTPFRVHSTFRTCLTLVYVT